MSATENKAVFLSYASQDADAARRICEALRAAGVEVWFDQSELVGGDAWDAKIRKQIATCDLFIPVISANTQARLEGYFRIEWKLAAQRTHAMADEKTFLLPVVIDDTRDAEAKVPAEFKAVQWTRLKLEATPAEFARRVQALLASGTGVSPVISEHGRDARATRTARVSRPRWPAVAIAAAVVVIAIGAMAWWQPWRHGEIPTNAPAAVQRASPVSEAQQLVLKARALYEPWDFASAEDFKLADELLKRAVDLEPLDADAWAAYALCAYGAISRGYDHSPARYDALRSRAGRAIKLDPKSDRALLAQACHFRWQQSTRAESERILRDLVSRHPNDVFLIQQLGNVLKNRGLERTPEALAAFDRAAALPAAGELGICYRAIALYGRALMLNRLKRYGEADASLDAALALRPDFGYARALRIDGLLEIHGDLPAARAAAEKFTAAYLLEDRGASTACRVWLWSREPEKVLRILVGVSREVMEGNYFAGPRDFLAGQALLMDGRRDAARAKWEHALEVTERQLAADRGSHVWLEWKARLLALLGRRAEAEAALAIYEQSLPQRGAGMGINTWRIYVALDRRRDVFEFIPRSLSLDPAATGAILRFDPELDPLRDTPEFKALLEKLPRPGGARQESGSVAPAASDKSVAVLAFRQLSADPENEYLCEAIADELCSVLGRVPGLKVTASASAFTFKGSKRERPAEMARQLGVAYLVDGSVQKIGGRLRVRALLIKAADESVVWKSDTFDEDLKDVFAVQDKLAAIVAQNLQLTLGLGALARRTENPEALRLYLQGRQLWSLRSREGIESAGALFSQALEIDPELTRARVGLADVSLQTLQSLGRGAFAERESTTLATIIREVEAVVAQEPSLAEARATLGNAMSMAWRPAAAIQNLQRAVELNPNYASAQQWLGRCLMQDGRMEEGRAALARAAELDPLSPIVLDNYGMALLFAGDPAKALTLVERALILRPHSAQTQAWKIWALTDLNRVEEALAVAAEIQARGTFTTDAAFAIAYVLKKATRTLEAEQFAARPDVRDQTRFLAVAASGQPGRALEIFEPEMLRNINIEYLFFPAVFDPVRSDPRFVSALRRLDLSAAHARAQAWRAANPPKEEAKE